MGSIHIQRIESAIQKLFHETIDMSDLAGKPPTEIANSFRSRAVAAYAVYCLADVEPHVASASVTDGYDDNGIDAVMFDETNNTLFVVQSKWIQSGKGTFDLGEFKKFADGFRNLVNLRLERFNDKMRKHESELRVALSDSDVRLVLVLAYTGTDPLSSHVTKDLGILLDEVNNPVEVVGKEVFDQSRLYNAIAGRSQRRRITLTIPLREWGHVSDPYPAFYGQVDAGTIASWWRDHGDKLFARNIRNFKGNTDVNMALASTMETEPQHLWYFNNGLTILSEKVAKQPLGAGNREVGVFECDGVSIVNGAQTVGVIGSSRVGDGSTSTSASVLLRIISLEKCPPGFDKEVTRATNTQNRIEWRDFAAIDPNQQRLAAELALDGIYYAYKSGDWGTDHPKRCSIVDATVALACSKQDVSLAVQAKREISRLWMDIETPPYTDLFNDHTSATEVWHAVEIMRTVDSTLHDLASAIAPRADMIAINGNRLILHRAFMDSRLRGFRREDADMVTLREVAEDASERAFYALCEYLERSFPTAYLASLFKNQNKCKEVDQHLAQTGHSTPARSHPSKPRDPSDQPTLFDAKPNDQQ